MAAKKRKATPGKTAAKRPAVKRAPAKKAAGTAKAVEPVRASAASAARAPLGVVRRFAEDVDRIFENFRRDAGSFLPQLGSAWESLGEAEWAPSVEVVERGKDMVVRAELPGLSKNDVKVEVQDGLITLFGERRQKKEEKKKGILRTERSYGSFRRTLALPEGVDVEQAKASFKDGILEVSFPAPPKPAGGRRVPIGD